MSRFARRVAASCMVAVACGLVVSSAAEAGAPSVRVNLKVSRHKTGPFGPDLRIHLNEGKPKNVYLKVKSITGNNEPTQLESATPPAGIAINYFTKNGKKITNDVFSSDGYDFTVKGSKPKLFRVKVKQVEPDVVTCFAGRVRDTTVFGYAAVLIAVNAPVDGCPT